MAKNISIRYQIPITNSDSGKTFFLNHRDSEAEIVAERSYTSLENMLYVAVPLVEAKRQLESKQDKVSLRIQLGTDLGIDYPFNTILGYRFDVEIQGKDQTTADELETAVLNFIKTIPLKPEWCGPCPTGLAEKIDSYQPPRRQTAKSI